MIINVIVPQLAIMATVESLHLYAYLTELSIGPNVFHIKHCKQAIKEKVPNIYHRLVYTYVEV